MPGTNHYIEADQSYDGDNDYTLKQVLFLHLVNTSESDSRAAIASPHQRLPLLFLQSRE